MKNKIEGYWQKTASLRASLPNLIRPQNVFKDENKADNNEESDDNAYQTFSERINENLLRYKEIKMVYVKTGVAPVYFLYGLIICLFLIIIGYFENYLTILIATLYPLYISTKTLQNANSGKDDIIQWLTYW
jgi:hypothetical protein